MGLRDDGGKWTIRDRGLAEGLTRYLDGFNSLGIPWDEALDSDNDGWFEVKPKIDYAEAAKAQWLEQNQETAKQPGLLLSVVLERDSVQ